MEPFAVYAIIIGAVLLVGLPVVVYCACRARSEVGLIRSIKEYHGTGAE